MPPLSAAGSALVAAAREVARRNPQLAAVGELSRQSGDDGVAAAREAALREVEALSRQGRKADFETAEREKQARLAAERAQREIDGVKLAVEAARKVDGYLARGGNIQARIDEGRASLTRYKLDRVLRDLMSGSPRVRSGAVVVAIAPAQLGKVQEALTAGLMAWVSFVLGEVSRDLQMAIEDAWTNLEADLPVDPPALPALTEPWSLPDVANRWWEAPPPPAEEVSFALKGMLGDLGRTIRQQMTSLLMVASLAGLAAFRGSPWMVVVVLFLVPVGWFVVSRDRQKRIQELAERGLKTCSDDLERWVESRLDRTRTKIRDYVAYQLQVPLRSAWKDWFRQEILPRQQAAQDRMARARREQEDARKARADFERGWSMAEIERLRELLRESLHQPGAVPVPG